MAKATRTAQATITAPVNSTAKAIEALKPHCTAVATEGGNGGQARHQVTLHTVSVSKLIRGLTQAQYPQLLISAMLAALGLPVSPDTVKTQRANQRSGRGKAVQYEALPADLRASIEALATALANDEASKPGTMSTLAKQLSTQAAFTPSPVNYLPPHLRPVTA